MSFLRHSACCGPKEVIFVAEACNRLVDENDKEPTCDAPESVDKRKLMVKVDAAKNAVKLPKYRVIFANHSRLALIVVLWIVFTWALVSAWQAKINFKPYDPFEILNVPSGSSEDVIKSAFKKLSRVHHPDKAAPENRAKAETKFVEISKAYKSLTDEKMRKNWEEHGNPDGIRTFALGVALPSWLVNSSNRMIVLALYCLAFGIGLPLLVKQWWSKSKHYTKDGLCHSSMSMFFRDLKENSSLKKILEMLANATEFIVDGDLKQDQAFVVSKAGKLVQGILQIALARQWLHPALSCMALSQYIVHGTWEGHSPLLQLPFITHDISRHSLTGRRAIKSIADLLDMNESDRRSLLRNLGDKEYSQALSIAQTFPMAQIDTVTFKVLGQESIVPGGLITCQVRLSLEYPRISTTEGIDDGGKEKVSIKPEDDVQTFEFDEDGNLLDDPGRKVTDSLTTARPVYSPRFPNTKRPFWWVSLVNKNNTNFVCLPVKVLDLVDRKTVTLQFPAPPKPMSVSLMLVIKSDSVMGVDITKEVKFIVMPPSGNSPNENWDISGDEEDQAVPFSSDDE